MKETLVDRMSFAYLPAPETYQSIERQLSRSPTPNKRYGFIKSESLDDTDTCSDRTSEEENDYRRAQPKREIVEEKNVKNKERKNSFFSISHNNNHHDNNNNNSHHNGEEKERKNSHFSISNVKRKLSHTFQRRNSTSTSPEMSRRKAPLKSKSSNFNNMHISPNSSPPELRRYAAVKNSHSHNEARWKGSTSMTHVHGNEKQYNNPEQRRKGSTNLMHPLVMSRKRSAGNPFAYASNPDIIQSTIPYIEKDLMKDFNIYCLGTKQTGKTALTVRFLTGRYIHEYTSSPVEKYARVMKYGEDRVNVSVFINDVDRMEEDIELGANSGIMIIYSITDKNSFKEATLLLNHLQELSITDHIPVVLIATKTDLDRQRKIKQKRGLDLANQFNCSQFDVSAAQDENVRDCFHAVFRQIEVRQFLKGNSEDDKTILTPRKFKSSGSFRYSTL